MTALISLSGVQKYFGDYHALRDIDLEIGQGEFFSLLGPSGCGKTTLLRTIAGFEQPDAGRLSIDGQDMAGVAANRRPTNMVFQSYAIFPHLTVGENVAFGLRRSSMNRAARRDAVARALDMVGLGHLSDRAAHALSGGQRQRVALARALILEPKVLLLDEPLSALDRKLREQMQTELRRLQRQVGITFILVTHDQEEALIMSDRIAVMFDGGIAQLDSPQSLYVAPRSRRVGEFIGMMNVLHGEVRAEGNRLVAAVPGLGEVPLDDAGVPRGMGPGPAVFGLRPETMSLVFSSGTLPTGYFTGGRIVDRAYYGDMTYYDIRLDGTDAQVTCSMKNLPTDPVLDLGSDVRLAYEPGALIVFPPDRGGAA